MGEEGLLDLRRPDQVTGRLDHVVGAPDEPEVAVGVAGVGHRAGVGRDVLAGKERARPREEAAERMHRMARYGAGETVMLPLSLRRSNSGNAGRVTQ